MQGMSGMRKRILITGGGGYVGRILVRSLYTEHDVCVVDTLQMGIERFAAKDLSSFRLEQVDICREAQLKRVIDDFTPDAIIHLAAIHYIPQCEREPGKALHTNVVGTGNLLDACPSGCRFVFASSGAVYSPSAQLHDEESSQIGPCDVYGFSKLHGEQLLRYFSGTNGFAAVVVRLFNVIGPGETNPHLLPEIVAQMKAGQRTLRLGNLWPKRDYIDVRDAAAGFAAAALNGSIAGGETVTVNLGTAQQFSVDEILKLLQQVARRQITVEEDKSRVRAVDRPFLGAAIGRIQAYFGWTPRYNIEDTVKAIWQDPDFSAALNERYGLSVSAREASLR
jgi:UDP-glucose 4-epimerase